MCLDVKTRAHAGANLLKHAIPQPFGDYECGAAIHDYRVLKWSPCARKGAPAALVADTLALEHCDVRGSVPRNPCGRPAGDEGRAMVASGSTMILR